MTWEVYIMLLKNNIIFIYDNGEEQNKITLFQVNSASYYSNYAKNEVNIWSIKDTFMCSQVQ